jgi:Flp pilus assembly protein CpaB
MVERGAPVRPVLAGGMSTGPAGPGPSERSAGRAGRRRALPGGRAVAGAFVIALAVVLVFAGWADSRPGAGSAWVVAARDLPAGTQLTSADLTTTVLRLGRGPVAAAAFARPEAVVGRVLAVPVGSGQLIVGTETRTAASAAALRPVPVTVASTDLVDLSAGDLVDVLETAGTSGGGGGGRTSVVVRGARVLSTEQPSGGLVGSDDGPVVTIGVSTLAEVEAVVAAEHAGTVDLVVGEPSDGVGPGAGGA